MSISFEVLGAAGRDNALWVRIDSGQSVDRLLFDCGEECLKRLAVSEIQAIDQLFFSHLHMDHVAGFDSFFRCNYNRDAKPNSIWGPPETARILQHRFRGYLWNLHHGQPGTWRIHDVSENQIQSSRFELSDAFSKSHDEGARPYDRAILDTPVYSVETRVMNHLTPSLAYIVREKSRSNVDSAKLQALGLRPGPWLKQLKEPPPGQTHVEINGVSHALETLRAELLVEVTGESIAYVTDLLLDDSARSRLVVALRGCKTLVCESQYRHADLDLALRNYHMTATLAAELAKQAGVGELILFHLSDRYTPDVWLEMLREAQAIFPNTRFPEQWRLQTTS